MPSSLLHYLQGLLMGSADSVPGVSGGTMALIVGIYERLLASIGSAFRALVSLVRLDWAGARSHLRDVEWGLVVPLAAGIGTAIIVASGFVPQLLDSRPAESRALFLGLVAASLAVPWVRIRTRSVRLAWVALAAAIPAFVLSGLPPGTVEDPSMLVVFAGAALAVSAMILPGVSGAFLLLVVGLYQPTLEAVHDRNLLYVGVFGVGMVVGLGLSSLVLGRLLDRHHDTTMAVLVGLMAGSLRALWPWQTDTRGLLSPTDPLVPLLLVVAGVAVVGGIQIAARVTNPRATADPMG